MEHYKMVINELVSKARNKFLTDSSNQSYIYSQKLQEAKDFLSTNDPVITDFSLLNADYISYNDENPTITANRIITSFNQTIIKLSNIERLKRQALLSLQQNEDPLEQHSIILQFKSDIESI